MTLGSAFWGAAVQNVSLASASSAWFYAGGFKGAQIIGSCLTYQRCVFC